MPKLRTDKTFGASADHVIKDLPDFIKCQLPFVFTARNGLDKNLVNWLARGQVNGQTATDASDCIAELQSISNHERMDMYYDFAVWGKSKQATVASMLQKPSTDEPVPEFDPKTNTASFSAAFLLFVFMGFIGQFKVKIPHYFSSSAVPNYHLLLAPELNVSAYRIYLRKNLENGPHFPFRKMHILGWWQAEIQSLFFGEQLQLSQCW